MKFDKHNLKTNMYNNHPNFKGRKVAVAQPLINGVKHRIEIYSVGKRDQDFFSKVNAAIDMEKLYPSKKDLHCFSFWKDIISCASQELGAYGKKKSYLAVKDNKPFGILVSSVSRKMANVDLFVTWPIETDCSVKAGGSSLFSAFLKFMENKKTLKSVSLEPVLHGPTDSVGFYKRHGMDFVDSKSSIMRIESKALKRIVDEKCGILNIIPVKNSQNVDLAELFRLKD